MRRGLGIALRVVLLVVGTVVLLAGAAASVLIGPDDTAQTGPHELSSSGVAVRTDPEAIHYVGPVLHLRVESSESEPVFVGIAHEVDGVSYLSGSAHLLVERVKLPWTPSTDTVGSARDALAPPAEQPWWLLSAVGTGAQELEWPLPHGQYTIVALNADGSPGVDLQVTLGLELEGSFYAALAVTALGLAILLLGLWLVLRARRRRRRTQLEQPYDAVSPAGAR